MPRTTRKQRKSQTGKTPKKPETATKVANIETPVVAPEPPKQKYRSFRLTKKIKHPGAKLSGSFVLTGRAFKHVWRFKKLFAIIALTYLALNLLLVRGFIFTADISVVKDAITELFSGSVGQIAGSLTVMSLLAGSLNPTTEVAALYQTILLLIFSLFMIWALRQTYIGEAPRAREVFYRSSYPLVQFVVVVFIIGLQLIPLMIANFLYSAVILSSVAVSFAEVFAVSAVIFLLIVWSLYMITVSIFALYIVALPDMTPLRALRSAKGLVNHRRWTVMRKVLFLPVALTVIGFTCMVPIIIIVPFAAEVIFLIGSAFMLPLVHSYMYSLYRELLA